MARIGRLDEYKPENESWSSYVERVELFMIANDVDDEKQVPTLLTAMGASTYGLLRNLIHPVKPKDKTFGEIVSILQAHFEPQQQHITSERSRFQRCVQKCNENVSQYVAELKHCASKCDFGASLDDVLRDRFVNGIQSETCRIRLRSEHSLTFKRAIEIALSMETAERAARQLFKTTTESLATVLKHPTHFQSKTDGGQFCRNGAYECPSCSFITKEKFSFLIHLENHMSHAVEHKGFFILKCNKLCRNTAHFHCLYCRQTVLRRVQYIRHLSNCSMTEPSTTPPLPSSVAGSLTSPPQITSFTTVLVCTPVSEPGNVAPPPPSPQPPPSPHPQSPPSPPPSPPQKIQKKIEKVVCPECGLSLNRKNVKLHVLRRHNPKTKEQNHPEPS